MPYIQFLAYTLTTVSPVTQNSFMTLLTDFLENAPVNLRKTKSNCELEPLLSLFSPRNHHLIISFFNQLDLPVVLNFAKRSVFGDIWWQNHTEKQKVKTMVTSNEKGEGYNEGTQ